MSPGSSFNLQPSPRRPRPLVLRITSLRNSNVLSNFYTLDFVPSATHSESTTSPLFEKQRGVHPPKRNPGETFANPIPVAAPADTPLSSARPNSATLLSLGAESTLTRSTTNV